MASPVTYGKEFACSAGNPGLIPGLGRSLEKGMATHSIILAGEFQGQRILVGYTTWVRKVNAFESLNFLRYKKFLYILKKICFYIKDNIQMSETRDFLGAVWYSECKIWLHVISSVTAEGKTILAQLEETGMNQMEGSIP